MEKPNDLFESVLRVLRLAGQACESNRDSKVPSKPCATSNTGQRSSMSELISEKIGDMTVAEAISKALFGGGMGLLAIVLAVFAGAAPFLHDRGLFFVFAGTCLAIGVYSLDKATRWCLTIVKNLSTNP